MPVAMPLTPNVAASTPLKVSAADIAAEGHTVPTAASAPIDIHVVLSSPSRIEREKAATELVDLVKLEGPAAFERLGLAAAIEKDRKSVV